MDMNTHTVNFGDTPMELVGTHLTVGDRAPHFTVVGGDLKDVTMDNFLGRVTILSIFPSVDTPVCALQNIRFNRAATELGPEITIDSISMDLPFAQKRFCAAEGIDRVETYSDYRQADFGMKYGFLLAPLRLLARGVVVIDPKGIIRHIEYVAQVTHEPDYEAALKVVRSLR